MLIILINPISEAIVSVNLPIVDKSITNIVVEILSEAIANGETIGENSEIALLCNSIALSVTKILVLFIGMIINHFWRPDFLKAGIKFASKKVLKFAIILLGASLSVGGILSVGKLSLMVMLFTLLTCFGGGYFIGKALKLSLPFPPL